MGRARRSDEFPKPSSSSDRVPQLEAGECMLAGGVGGYCEVNCDEEEALSSMRSVVAVSGRSSMLVCEWEELRKDGVCQELSPIESIGSEEEPP